MNSNSLILYCLLGLLAVQGLRAADQAPGNPERLEKMLQRFPKADTNKDGKLTMEEAREYLRQKKTAKPGGATAATPAAPKPLEIKPGAAAAKAPAASPTAGGLEPMLGTKGKLLLEETFDGDALAQGWTGKTGGLRVADGVLHASMKSADGRLGLFSREQPMQNAVIAIDFRFVGARGINISCNPSPGELAKHGHLFSVMITPSMWNITEHNDKSDPNSKSQALASASASFVPNQWYKLMLETKGDQVVARVEGKEPLRASSKDFGVKKPGIEFRVSGRDGEEVLFDNLRVWELE
jgi:hypothetical protein